MRFYILGKVFKRDDLTRSRITLDDAIVDNTEFFIFYLIPNSSSLPPPAPLHTFKFGACPSTVHKCIDFSLKLMVAGICIDHNHILKKCCSFFFLFSTRTDNNVFDPGG